MDSGWNRLGWIFALGALGAAPGCFSDTIDPEAGGDRGDEGSGGGTETGEPMSLESGETAAPGASTDGDTGDPEPQDTGPAVDGDTSDTGDTGDESTGDTGDESTGDTGDTGDESTGDPIVDACDNGTQTVEPVIWLRFEGDVANDGSSGATVQGGAFEVDYVEGKCATAVAFDSASTSYVELIDSVSAMTGAADYTIGVWFFEASVTNQGQLLDFRAGASGSDGGGFQSYHGASDALTTCASTTPSGGTCRSVSADLVPPGQWHHLLFRCDGDGPSAPDGCDLEVFIDGLSAGGASTLPLGGNVTFSAAQADDLRLGRNTNFVLDDFKVFDQVFDLEGQCVEVIGGTWLAGACTLP